MNNEVDTYIDQFPQHVQELLQEIRKLIKKNAPESIEMMAYGMPAYKTYKRPLVYFAAFKNHIGFYALPTGHNAFQQELSAYKQGKGSVQFPLDKPIPFDLIERIVQFRVAENNDRFNRGPRQIKKTCAFGHTFYKSSDCPTCPTCEKQKEPVTGFLALLSNPARNTLLHNGIDTIEKLASYTEKEVLNLHGIGKASLPVFRKALEDNGLAFKKID